MPGLVPGIHAFANVQQDVDGRDICAKTRFALLPGHDEESGSLGLTPGRLVHAGLGWLRRFLDRA
jgi:hypothetical protein